MPKLGEDRPYEMRLRDEAASARTSHDALADSRLLILSFLYDERYYQHHLQELIRRRFDQVVIRTWSLLGDQEAAARVQG